MRRSGDKTVTIVGELYRWEDSEEKRGLEYLASTVGLDTTEAVILPGDLVVPLEIRADGGPSGNVPCVKLLVVCGESAMDGLSGTAKAVLRGRFLTSDLSARKTSSGAEWHPGESIVGWFELQMVQDRCVRHTESLTV